MTAGIVALFLVGPWLLVPLALTLMDRPADRVAHGLTRTAARAVLPAAALLTLAFIQTPGTLAGALALPWLIVAALGALGAVISDMSEPEHWRPTPRRGADVARGFLVVSASFALFDRLGIRPFDFTATIILLTAVHFQFAGFVLVLAGSLTWRSRPTRWLGAALGAVVLGIPLTAVGFFGFPIVAWVGVVVVAVGALGIGLGMIREAAHMSSMTAGRLSLIAGSALFVSMPMAVIYSTGTLTGAGWLGIPAMAGIHGTINALGFAVPAMAAWTIELRRHR